MASSTVLRVKRRLEDNPQDALVLMCKRMKTDTDEISPSLFVFRGTVENQETPNVKNIVPKTGLKQQSTSKVEDIIQKLRKDHKAQSNESRYEVVNCSRRLKDSETVEFDLVDLKRTDDEEGDVQYAYDLYMAATKDFDVSMLDNLVRIENYESDLVFNSQNGASSSSDEADDDDDSNDENNWRNEYPDSEPDSIDEEDMIRAMENVAIENDLSSDEGEDKIYNDPLVYNDDAKRYGEAYAKYKARVMGEAPALNDSRGFVHCAVREIDEESVEGYKDSDDEGFYYGQEQDGDQFREQYASDASDEYRPD